MDVASEWTPSRWTQSFAKRMFDFVVSAFGISVLWPLFLVVALLIKMEDGGPIFFRQERVGFKGKIFRIWKFRTMVVDADRKGIPLAVGRDSRITRVGHWLRKTKVDELPQLFNVFLGEMSFVGPRPEIPYFTKFYTHEQEAIWDIKPGITSPASLLYRNESEVLAQYPNPEQGYINDIMPRKIRVDLKYFSRATFVSDLCIIIRTLISRFPCKLLEEVTVSLQ